jgi:hypothetical protein
MPNFGEMTVQHVIYIPCVLLVGLICGFIWGSRAVRAEMERRKRRMKE